MSTRFDVTLESPRDDTPEQAVRRLRAFLKTAWRMFGLRCVQLSRTDHDDQNTIKKK